MFGRPKRFSAAAIALTATMLAVFAGPGMGAVGRSGAQVPSTPHGILWGAEIGTQFTGVSPPWDMSAVSDFQRVVGKAPSLIPFNIPFFNCPQTRCAGYPFPSAALQRIRDYGALPVLNWASTSNPLTYVEPWLTLRRIASGRYDAYLRRFAHAAAAWRSPLFLRFDWEMNGNWFPWSDHTNGNDTGDFVRAWRHVHSVFVAQGARNVSWVWCPYVSRAPGARTLAEYWPGAAYVDWTCLDAYNYGPRFSGPHSWRSFDALTASSYREVQRLAPTKPVMIGEVASSQFGGDKAAWIRQMFASIRSRYPRIGAVLWWDVADPRPRIGRLKMLIEDSPSSAAAFAAAVRPRAYLTNTLSRFTGNPIPMPRLP